MTNQKKKKNHWVSQAYLRQFAAEPLDREKIWCLHALDGEPELKPIAKVAVKFYLYTPKGVGGGRDYSFEDKLGSLEQLFGLALWERISAGFVDLRAPSIRKGIALLAAVMFLRHPAAFDRWKELHRLLVSRFSAMPTLPDSFALKSQRFELDKADWNEFRTADDDALKRSWLAQIGSATGLAQQFLPMRWSIMATDGPAFITSDNPVVPLHENLRFRGFANPGTSILFPLGPTRLLCMDWITSEPDGEYYAATAEGVAASNFNIWRNSDRMLTGRHPDDVLDEIVRHFDRPAAA